jgi:hypothetical protein
MNVRRFLPAFVLGTAPVVLAAGCGSGGTSGFGGEVGIYQPDGGSFLGSGDASASGAFDAHIEENRVTVTFVTLSCTGPCATVQAVGTGGYPPYAFQWDDGSTSASRRVCPTASTSYDVNVTDTGTSGELARPAQTVHVPLKANVITCPDGGALDAGPSLPADACVGGIENPSFEGTPSSFASISLGSAPPWASCGLPYGAPGEIVNGSANNTFGAALASPSDGQTYAAIQVTYSGALLPGGIGQQLCSPITGAASFELDAMKWWPVDDAGANPSETDLQIFGGDTACCGDMACASAPLLWTSPPLAKQWTTYCATLSPAQATQSLTLFGQSSPATGDVLILVDHIVPVASCP